MTADRPSVARLSRRALLGAAAGGTGAVLGARLAAASSHDLRVMTRNLYVGVDLFRLARAEDRDDLERIAGALLDEVRAHPYGARMDAIAAEVAATEPDVVGLQEAALVRTREPSEFDGDHDPGAEDVVVDLLARLEAALAARDLEYEVASSVVTNDVEVPASTEDGTVDIRVTDRTAVLVRADVDVEDARADRFDAAVPLPLDGAEIDLRRGYCSVDLSVAGEAATVATTHLESLTPDVRRSQATELLDALPTGRPVVVAGDLNSGPGGSTAAYDALTGSFDDAVAAIDGTSEAHTCCFEPDLRGDRDSLSRRVDVVLYRGRLRPTDAEIVGADTDARVRVEREGETARLWPSDHAGVVASFELGVRSRTATATTATTPTPTDASTGTESDPVEQQPEGQAGFGWLASVGAALVAALERRRRGGE